ncbi:NAD(P)H-dependent glycerol-3-phosphate dehydrogenase [candidate division KSB1 bacterium]
MNQNPQIAVVGGGSWGTALIKLLSNNTEKIHWWVRKKENANHIKQYHRNPVYLSYMDLDTSKLIVSTSLKETINNCDYIIFAIPAAFLKPSLEKEGIDDLSGKTIISAIKGIIPVDNLVVSEYFRQKFKVPNINLGIIAGPCHSEEVAMEKLSFLTLAFKDKQKASYLMQQISSEYMKISITDDLIGAEYAAVLKNIIAIANGICIGLGYGDNFQSVLIVNAIQEMRRFLDKINFIDRDINNSVYLGDLVVTAYSKFSRNRTFGNMIGKGYSSKFAQIEMKMVAEGYYAVKCIYELNKQWDVHMPITDTVYNIIYNNKSPIKEIRSLAEKLN